MTYLERFPFRDDDNMKVLKGVITAYPLLRKFGDVGDTFTVTPPEICIEDLEATRYELIEITEHQMAPAFSFYFREMGCLTPTAALSWWDKGHPAKRYRDTRLVWIHFFREVQ